MKINPMKMALIFIAGLVMQVVSMEPPSKGDMGQGQSKNQSSRPSSGNDTLYAQDEYPGLDPATGLEKEATKPVAKPAQFKPPKPSPTTESKKRTSSLPPETLKRNGIALGALKSGVSSREDEADSATANGIRKTMDSAWVNELKVSQIAAASSRIFLQTEQGQIFTRNAKDTEWIDLKTTRLAESPRLIWLDVIDSSTLVQGNRQKLKRLGLGFKGGIHVEAQNTSMLKTSWYGHLTAFLTPQTGILAGFHQAIGLTQDSGITWKELSSGPNDGRNWRNAQALRADSMAYLVGDSGAVARFKFQDSSVQFLPVPQGPHLNNLAFTSPAHGVVGGDGNWLAVTRDSGKTWVPQSLPADSGFSIQSIAFVDAEHGFISGHHGGLYETRDGGSHWRRITQRGPKITDSYMRFPPPGYFLVVAFVLFLIWPAFTRQPPKIIRKGIGENLASDTPLESASDDKIGLAVQAQALTGFLMNPATKAPLTFGVLGEWGKGKSSFLRIAQGGLNQKGFVTVWFNAWHHQSEESLLAALLESIRRSELLRMHTFDGFLFRVRLTWRRFLPQLPKVMIAFALGLLFFFIIESQWPSSPGQRIELVHKIIPDFVSSQSDATAKGLLELLGNFLKNSPVLLPIFALWKAIRRILVLFESQPAHLLSGLTEGAKIQDLSKKVGFRETFRREFEEVTSALADKPMVIFIDDLDRCRPATVMETLEAINFLVTCGPCFFVIAMDKIQVAQAIITQDEAYLKRFRDENRSDKAYAQSYLEKLIQVEVALPQADPAAFKTLLSGSAPAPKPPLRGRLWLFKRYSPLIFIVILALLCIGFFAPQFKGNDVSVGSEKTDTNNSPVPSVIPATSHPTGNAVKPAPVDTMAGKNNPPPPPQTSANNEKPSYVAGKPNSSWTRFLTWTVLYLVMGFMVIAFFAWRERRGRLEYADSDEFAAALSDWSDLVHLAARTPRGAKKYINRLRFFANLRREWQRQWDALKALPNQSKEFPVLPGDADLVILSSMELALRTLLNEPLDLSPENLRLLKDWLRKEEKGYSELADKLERYALTISDWPRLLEGFALLGAQVSKGPI